jgi:ferredoxin-NADP reductase
MYALIYDEHQLDRPNKKVISIHKKRETAEAALKDRMKKLGRSVTDCNTRIVWVEKKIRSGDTVGPGEYETWRPGEAVPLGEMLADSD